MMTQESSKILSGLGLLSMPTKLTKEEYEEICEKIRCANNESPEAQWWLFLSLNAAMLNSADKKTQSCYYSLSKYFLNLYPVVSSQKEFILSTDSELELKF